MPGPLGEDAADGLLLLVVPIQVEQRAGVVAALRFHQPQGLQRTGGPTGHQRTDPQRRHHRLDVGPRQRRRIDAFTGVPGFVGVDTDLPHSVQLQAYRAGAHRPHRERRREQHLLGVLPTQAPQSNRDVHVGGGQYPRLVERPQQTGPPLRQLNRGHRGASPARS